MDQLTAARARSVVREFPAGPFANWGAGLPFSSQSNGTLFWEKLKW